MKVQKNGFVSKIILGLLLICSLPLTAQTINTKQLNLIVTYPDSVIKLTAYNGDKQVKVKDNCLYYWYANNQVHCNKAGYSGKLLDGTYSVFDRAQKLIAAGTYKMGRKDGVWKYWYTNGQLKTVEEWSNGSIENKKLFSSAGDLQQYIPYKNGLIHGKVNSFEKDSTIVTKYKKGEIVTPKPKKAKKFKEKMTKHGKKSNKKEAKSVDKKTGKEKASCKYCKKLKTIFKKKEKNSSEKKETVKTSKEKRKVKE